MAESYDPIDMFYRFLTESFDWSSISVSVIKAYEYKNLNVAGGDYIVIERAVERDEFFGIGGLEYRRFVTVYFTVYTAESRERSREIVEKVRAIIRDKGNWSVDGRLMYNIFLARQEGRTDMERGLFSHLCEVEWFEIEKVV